MLKKNNVENIVDLSYNQEGILIHYLRNPESTQYHIQFTIQLEGNINIILFEQAWNHVISNNEMLRTVFRWKNVKRPIQIILKSNEIEMIRKDFDSDIEFQKFVLLDYEKPFNLEQSCLRISICKLGKEKYAVVMSVHHIIYDGWSNGVLWKELFEAYHNLCQEKECIKKEKQKYSQYINVRKQSSGEPKKEFWEKYLEDIDEIAELKEKANPTNTKGKFSNCKKKLSQELQQNIDSYIQNENVSLANLIYASWGVLLQFYCNKNDVMFGRVSSGRNVHLKGIEEMIGLFINVLPMRIKMDKKQSVKDVLDCIKEEVLAMESFEGTPLYEIKDYIGLHTNGDLFNSIVVIENYPLDIEVLKRDENIKVIDYCCKETNHYDLTLSVDVLDGIQLQVIYNNTVFSEVFINKILERLIYIMQYFIGCPDNLLEDIKIVDEQEEQLLESYNSTESDFVSERNVVQLFEEQVMENPKRIALISNDAKLTYQEFNEKSNQIAHFLIEQGIQRNDIVGVMLERTIQMMQAIYGVLKSGAAYLPIDSNNPDGRINYIIENAKIEFILSSHFNKGRVNNGVNFVEITDILKENYPMENPLVVNEPDDICYVIYTSGTTGNPKGVAIQHNSLVNRLTWMQKNTSIGTNDIVLQKTNYTFDVSVWELIWWSLHGATLSLLKPNGEKNPDDIINAIYKNQVTTIHFVPSMLNVFLLYLEMKGSKEKLSSLKYVITSGEALALEHVKRFYSLLENNKQVRLVNLYGPTEATIDVSYYNCPRDCSELNCIPIGKPIDNIKLHVLAPNGQLQPTDIVGELCISGIGLAKEYLNQPELTAEKFVYGKINGGERYYRTGDLAKWTSDGQLEYLGRIDNQIKIRGFRIELDEIETIMRHLDEVDDVVVLAKKDQQKEYYLCAYIVTKNDLDVKMIQNELQKHLPIYMVPSFVIQMRAFPVKSNGKVDRSKLSSITSTETVVASESANSFSSEIQETISRIWGEILPNRKFGIYDNFFDVGGNSISLIRIYSKLNELYPEKLNVEDLFTYPTIADLAFYIVGEEKIESIEETEGGFVNEDTFTEGVAVVGIAGMFPEADNVNEYWSKLAKGKECIYFYTKEELEEAKIPKKIYEEENYVNALGRLKNGRAFDSKFFNYTQAEALLLDPQIRLMMMNVWEALEDSGYCNDYNKEKIGLFVGASPNYFWEKAVITSGKANVLGDFSAEKLFNKDHIAAQIAYKLNLTGPVCNVYSACSTSLVAVHLAANAIKNKECTMAVAGGVSNVSYYGNYGYVYQDGMVFSPDGHCRPFDQSSNGFVGGTGVGSVVLKRLDLAKRDGDHIYCVIKGSGISNDGNQKVGYASPSVVGQVNAVKEAFRNAAVEPESISYIETHGTGTELGDLVEVKALEQVYGTKRKNYCALGSVKANIGHLDCAAGIAGFIKTVLVLKNRVIPPLINMNVPNLKLNLLYGPFYVNDEAVLVEETEKPFRAAVNAIGLGGTNAHVILEEYRDEKKEESITLEESSLCLSAKTETSLQNMCWNLGVFLKKSSQLSLSNVAYTLKTGRKSFEYRVVIPAKNQNETASLLKRMKQKSFKRIVQNTELLFCISNQPMYISFDKSYYFKHPMLLEKMSFCLEIIKELTGIDLKQKLFEQEYSSEQIEQLELAKILDFAIQLVNVQSFISLDIVPNYLYGTGIGEFVCMVIADVITPYEAFALLIYNLLGESAFINAYSVFKIQNKEASIKYFIGKKHTWYEKKSDISIEDLLELDVYKDTIHNENVLGKKEENIQVTFDCFDMINQLESLWEKGVQVNWNNLYGKSVHKKLSLPTYAFDKHDYWIENEIEEKLDESSAGTLIKREDISDWFYIPYWEQELNVEKEKKISNHILFFTDRQDTTSNMLIQNLKGKSKITTIYFSSSLKKISEDEYDVNPMNEADYVSVLKELKESGLEQISIIYSAALAMNNEENEQSIAYQHFFSALYLCKSINKVQFAGITNLKLIIRNGVQVNGVEVLHPEAAMLHALGIVASQEFSVVRVQVIDIGEKEKEAWKEERLVKLLLEEVYIESEQSIFAYRNNRRYVKRFKQQQLPKVEKNIVKESGVYLILGGLGGVGTELSKYFAKKRAKLVLTGRTEIPERSNWDSWLQNNEVNNSISQKILHLKEIESLGAEVCTLSADVTSEEEMNQLINTIDERFGHLDGVVFATVANNKTMFQSMNDLEKEACLEQFRPKITGINVLERVLKNQELDFCLIMSSTSAVLGGLGFGAYSAANAYMDCFVQRHNQKYANQWTTVDWESWTVATNQSVFDFKAGIEELSMTPAEGTEVFERIINNQMVEHVVVSSGDIQLRLEKWVNLNLTTESKKDAVISYDDIELSTEYIAPKSELEDIIAQVWAEFFGIAKVGIDDNLFELGATSLSIIQLNTNLRNAINRNIPIVKFFAYPTVRQLASYLSDEQLESENNIERKEQMISGRESVKKRLQLRKKR